METIISNCELNQSEGISLTIKEINPNKKSLLILLILSIIIISIPIFLFFLIVMSGEGIPFGFLITCIVAMITSGYLLKLYLWNKYGKECFIIKNGVFLHFYDYCLFKDYQQEYNYSAINISVLYQGKLRSVNRKLINILGNDVYCCIYFLVDEKTIISHTAVPIGIIEKYLTN